MKFILSFLIFTILFSCTTDEKTFSNEIWEYNRDGKLFAISNYQPYTKHKHYSSEDGFIFESAIKFNEIREALLKSKISNLVDLEAYSVLLYAKEHEKQNILKILNSDSIKPLLPFDIKFIWSKNPTQNNLPQHLNSKENYFELFAYSEDKNNRNKITNLDIQEATVGINTLSNPVLNITYTPEGTEKLKNFTEENIGKCVLIIFDNEVIMAPHIMDAIPNGKVEVSGNETIDYYKILATTINHFTRNGEWRCFYPNGKLREIRHYEKGIQVGEFTRFDRNGKKIRTSKI